MNSKEVRVNNQGMETKKYFEGHLENSGRDRERNNFSVTNLFRSLWALGKVSGSSFAKYLRIPQRLLVKYCDQSKDTISKLNKSRSFGDIECHKDFVLLISNVHSFSTKYRNKSHCL